jgi:dolichol-phosphate mannosyltransferase
MGKASLGIIIPVYNEGENIKSTVKAIEENIKTPHRIYIVYDFDEDDTIPVAKDLIKKGIEIVFIRNPLSGVVNAIKKGLKEAEEEWILVSMADLSDDYRVVDTMCSLMKNGYDVVCGSRYMKDGRQIGGPFIKKTISRIAGISLKYLAGLPTHDATNSFKLYRKSMIDLLDIESDGGFEIGMEIVIKSHFSGFKVKEVPCQWVDRKKGKSRFKLIRWAPNYLRWYFYAIRKSLSIDSK